MTSQEGDLSLVPPAVYGDPVTAWTELRNVSLAIMVGVTIAYAAIRSELVDTWPDLPEVDTTARVLWLGDSQVARMPSVQGQNLGVDGYATRHLLDQVPRLTGSRAEVVVLEVGVHDLLEDASPTETAEGVAAVVDAVQATLPAVTVVVVGILPAPRVHEDDRRETNALLAQLDGGNTVFVEPPDRLSTTPDGLHLAEAGYRELWVELDPVLDCLLGREVAR